jgi:hypothetical protein
MGFSTVDIDKERAKNAVLNPLFLVFSASKEKYFYSKNWARDIVRAQAVQERDELIITLKNGDFVQVERV